LPRIKAAGCRPVAIVATVGTTSTTSVDPVRAIAAVARRENLAPRGWSLTPPWPAFARKYDRRWTGWTADSIVTNPHKWLFVPVDCSLLLVRRPELCGGRSIVPDYLTTTETGGRT
jgi:aromatic-L-amino-acid decarboxylase